MGIVEHRFSTKQPQFYRLESVHLKILMNEIFDIDFEMRTQTCTDRRCARMARKVVGQETQEHRHAFEMYFAMGDSRSLAAVATETGKSITTISSWSRSFGWTERVEKRNSEVAEQINKKAVKQAATRKIEYLNTIHKGMKQFEDGLKDGTIKVKSVGDAEKLVNMYMKLIGESQVNSTTVTLITAHDIIMAERRSRDDGDTRTEVPNIDLSAYTAGDTIDVTPTPATGDESATDVGENNQ